MPTIAVSHPDWHGRSIADFIVDERTIPVELHDSFGRDMESEFSSDSTIVPRFISGIFDAQEFSNSPVEIVLTIDGIVRDTSKTTLVSYQGHGFEFLITESMAPGSVGKVELFVVDSKPSEVRLRRIKVEDRDPQE